MHLLYQTCVVCIDSPTEKNQCLTFSSVCNSEQAGARALGYTQVSWNNLSGRVRQPLSSLKSWKALTANEKVGAKLLGYKRQSWDNESGDQPQPASTNKFWHELTACGEGEHPSIPQSRLRMLVPAPSPLRHILFPSCRFTIAFYSVPALCCCADRKTAAPLGQFTNMRGILFCLSWHPCIHMLHK